MFVKSIAWVSVRLVFPILASLVVSACGPAPQHAMPAGELRPSFAGSAICGNCHAAELAAWRQSHHALAMQAATPGTVLGDFSDVHFDYFGTVSTFYERDGRFYVRTDNDKGEFQDFAIAYTFGVDPLQQYLVEFPGGKLQVLPFAWDNRSTDSGGRRWFHIYPDEQIDHSDPLYWTGREQNWNYMCAECHSTGLEKNYHSDSDSFETTWFEISVGCEGCHGPGSRHVEEAEAGKFGRRGGFVTDLDDTGRGIWEMNPATGIAARSEIRMHPPVQPEACGRCHARRSVIADHYEFGKRLTDTHTPALLEEGLYFADGQIQDEVYVYGSFLQSRMYQSGVSCSDCHDPHSARLKTTTVPSAVCAKCHLPARFDSTSHHHHPQGSVACVDCHMTSRTYMVVDQRRDHSFRIPRPDLSITTGAPNACNQCHSDRDAQWAAGIVTSWYGDNLRDHYGLAIHAGRTGGGNQPLLAAIGVPEFPGIARASMLTLLRPPYSAEAGSVIATALGSADPLVRIGALRALPGLDPRQQADLAAPSLLDEIRSLRLEAARVISPQRQLLRSNFDQDFRKAELELEHSMLATAERPESQTGLGNLYAEAGDPGRAEAAYRQALRLDPGAVGPRINLADLYRGLGRDDDAEASLREGIRMQPEAAAYRHALGLLLVRRDRPDEALHELELAAQLQPADARYTYVYAVALNSLGQADAAITYLQDIEGNFPGDFDIHWALATMLRDHGRVDEARAVAVSLAEIYPGIRPLENLLRSL